MEPIKSGKEMEEVGKAGGLDVRHCRMDPKALKLLDENAHFMSAEKYGQLKENIARDGVCTSAPLVYREDGGDLLVLSGNHRTQAAIDVGLEEIDVLIIESRLTRDEQKAIQLSHNALVGDDNSEILRRIYESISSVELREYSGLSKQDLAKLDIPMVPPVDARVVFEQMTILFLPGEIEKIGDVLVECNKRGLFDGMVCIETKASYERVTEAVRKIMEIEKVHNYATVFLTMAEYALNYIQSQTDAGEVTL